MPAKSDSKRRGGVLSMMHKFLSGILLGANLVFLILLWLCCLSTHVSPVAHGHIAVLGLAFPVVLLLNLFFIPLWLFVRWRWMFVPIVGIALVGSYVLDYFPLSTSATPQAQDSAVRVISWNVKGYGLLNDRKDSLVAQFKAWDADIFCLQESTGGTNAQEMNKTLESMGYHMAECDGRRVYSRWPILRSHALDLPSATGNGAMIAYIQMPTDTLVLINCHLESNGIDDKDRTDGKAAISSGESDKVAGQTRRMWGKLAEVSRRRGSQVDALSGLLDSLGTERPIVLCGDFNDTPISYAYQQIEKRLENAYRAAGRGLGVSYNERYFLIRIDHLFYSPYWEATSAEVYSKCSYSDHNPLCVTLTQRKQ